MDRDCVEPSVSADASCRVAPDTDQIQSYDPAHNIARDTICYSLTFAAQGDVVTLRSIVTQPKNRQLLSWLGGGIIAVASGAWAVGTYVWPAHDSPGIVCAQQGSVAAGRDAKGNTITYTAPATAAPCSDSSKK
jgi:hypothetical protein